jgi:hypothetical protein
MPEIAGNHPGLLRVRPAQRLGPAPGGVPAVRDITQHKQLEEQLRESERDW